MKKYWAAFPIILFCPLYGQARPVTHCIMSEQTDIVVSAKTGIKEELDTWSATCTIKDGNKLIAERRLILPYPATLEDAQTAVRMFMKETQYIILEDAGYKVKRPKEKQ